MIDWSNFRVLKPDPNDSITERKRTGDLGCGLFTVGNIGYKYIGRTKAALELKKQMDTLSKKRGGIRITDILDKTIGLNVSGMFYATSENYQGTGVSECDKKEVESYNRILREKNLLINEDMFDGAMFFANPKGISELFEFTYDNIIQAIDEYEDILSGLDVVLPVFTSEEIESFAVGE